MQAGQGPVKVQTLVIIIVLLFASGVNVISNLPVASAATFSNLQVLRVNANGYEAGTINVPANTIDNNLSTRWSNLGKGSWLTFDLGAKSTISFVDIAWYKGDTRQSTFTISLSSDNISYSMVYSGKSSGKTLSFERYDFADREARYVKITVKGNTENNWASITEVDVYGVGATISLDITPPQITAPPDITTISTGMLTAIILGNPSVTDNLDPSPIVTNNAPSTGFPVGITEVTWTATDHSGNAASAVQKVTITSPSSPTSSMVDKFGVTMVNPTAQNGRVWFSKWDNGVSRTFGNYANDPFDPEFITSKNSGGMGDGSYKTSGDGVLKISGQYPRMYVVDPSKDWRNVEITVYGMRISDTNIAWAGLQAYARTNHGAIGDEETNECDNRGYGAQFTYPGKFLFEKETAHHQDNGYAQVNEKTLFSGGMPLNQWVGYKFVVRDVDAGTHVKLEAYLDMTNGANGGTWTKISEFTDMSNNFGVGYATCNAAISPSLPLTSSNNRLGTETGRPNVAIYFRSDGVNIDGLLYKAASIREINPLP